MPLTNFLLSRIAEDEAVARAAEVSEGNVVEIFDSGPGTVGDHYGQHGPSRVLADCDAKRRIVEHVQGVGGDAGDPAGVEPESLPMATHVLRLLALPFADHPDYREEWRP
jgi:Family of unknown function (DUF6221)